jgi:hypothetical protein
MNDHATPGSLQVGPPVRTDIWKIGAMVFAVGIALWMVFIFFSPPRLPGGDVTCFKDPGINLAQGKGLVEIATPGNPTLTPRFYSNYPPLFPALYGLYVTQFGVSAKADSLFDFILSAGACVLFWFFVSPRYADRRGRVPCLILLGLLLMLLPVGPFWTQRERPDALGFIVVMASLWMGRGGLTPKRAFLAAFIAGIGSLISPFTFVLNGIAIGFIILIDGGPLLALRRPYNSKFLRLVAAACAGVVIPVASLFLVQWLNDPETVARFISNVMGKSSQGKAGAGYFASLLAGDFRTYISAFSRFDSFRYKWMLAHLIFVAAVTTICLIRAHTRTPTAQTRWQPLATIGLAAIPLLVFPYQPCYMSLSAAMVMILFALLSGKNTDPGKLPDCWVALAGITFIALVAAPFMLREFVFAFQARDSYQKSIAIIRQFGSAPNRRCHFVAANATSYFLFKQAGFEVVEVAYLQQPADIARMDMFAFNTRDEASHFPDWWEEDKMETVYLADKSPDLRLFGFTIKDVKLFGINIYKSCATWEPNLYRYKQ